MLENYREQYIRGLTGHLQINKVGYYEDGVSDPFAYLLEKTSKIGEQVEAVPEVELTVPQVRFNGLASSEISGISAVGIGVDALDEQRMNVSAKGVSGKNSPFKIVQGQDLSPDDPSGVVLGQGLRNPKGPRATGSKRRTSWRNFMRSAPLRI